MSQPTLQTLRERVVDGTLVPYLGPGILTDVLDDNSGETMPHDSDSMILALNGGRPMAPRLMYEYTRAAMDLELKRGRSYLTRTMSAIYERDGWSTAAIHRWLAERLPPFVVDTNYDNQLQKSYSDTPHTLVRGISRIANDFRFVIHHYDGNDYREIEQGEVDTSLPILFKPMGSPLPEPTYIISDADYVDYITELMGGFAIPDFLKAYRKERQYLFIGVRLTRDTQRMVLGDITYDATEPRGYALIAEPTKKEQRYCKRMGIEIIDATWSELVDGMDQLDKAG